MPGRLATTRLVVPAWINSIPSIGRTPPMVSDQLPTDNTTWGPSGYCVVRSTGGGRHSSYIPVARPVITVDSYAVEPGTGRPLWNVATRLIAEIVRASRDEATMRRPLTIVENGVDYGKVYVANCYPINHERPSYGDESQYAHVILDMLFHWVQLEEGEDE